MILPPLPDGVSDVTLLWLYTDRARTQDQRIVPVALVDGQWTVDLLNIPQGRWWGTVNAQKDGADYSYPLLDPIDLPEDDRLIVSPEALATSIRIPLPLAEGASP